MASLVFKTVKELSELIQNKKASSLEIIKDHFSQIKLYNKAINAIVTLNEESALLMAKKADEEIAKNIYRSPIHGIPITVKDSIATMGIRTTSGYSPLKDFIPDSDAVAVAKMKEGGAIIIGKTNTPPLTFGMQTKNDIFGRTNNPWNYDYTPGGSSGGSAACVASGMSPLDLGSDTSGSIRVPAHFCGVYGFKATLNSISSIGNIPGIDFKLKNFRVLNTTTMGPLARSIEDLKTVYKIISEPNTNIQSILIKKKPQKKLKDIRFAWIPTIPGIQVASEISAAIQKLDTILLDIGCHVEQAFPDIDFEGYIDFFTKFDNNFFTAFKINEYKKKLNNFYEAFDVLICPPCFAAAFRHCEPDSPLIIDDEPANYSYLDFETSFFSFTGQPAVVMPFEISSDGLPIGIQLVSNLWQDEKLLSIASEIEPLTGGFKIPSGY